jgi:hypothetical protein
VEVTKTRGIAIKRRYHFSSNQVYEALNRIKEVPIP